VILVLRWLGVWRLTPYALAGIALWGAVYASGVHATLAGVLVGLLVPSRSSRPVDVAVVPKYAKRLAQETTAGRGHLTELRARAARPCPPGTASSAGCPGGARRSSCPSSASRTRACGSTASRCAPPPRRP